MALVAAAALAVTGCGGNSGGGSSNSVGSKPQYCSDRRTLERSVKGLKDVKVLQSGGVQALQPQLATVQSDAEALASSAKSAFGSESSAVKSSVSTLKTAVQALPASPAPQQLKPVAADVKATVTAFDNFMQASDSKCL